jgi:hypothetical protein
MKNITESLAGRVGLVNMYPLSMDEMLRGGVQDGENCFFRASLRSSYPEPFINHKIKMEQWFDTYVKTYVQRDVRGLYNVGKLVEFEAFIKMLANQAGQIMNLNRFSKGLGVAVNTLKNWISILQASGIIYILYPYFRNVSKRLTRNPKVYFMDTGLLCSLERIKTKEELKDSSIFGSIFENYCIIETIKYFSNRGSKKDFYFLREQGGSEIDLLIESGQKLYPVEIKTSSKGVSDAAQNMEKCIFDFKNIPIDKGHVLLPAGKPSEISLFASVVGLDDYFKILEKLIK